MVGVLIPYAEGIGVGLEPMSVAVKKQGFEGNRHTVIHIHIRQTMVDVFFHPLLAELNRASPVRKD